MGEDGHPLHVVHRDVSPQNILISAGGQVRLTDFGVAKARGQIHAPTQTGEVKGKLSYMAPEQVTTKDVDRRADVFALGCVLYEATVGERPFTGGDALATLYQLLEQPIPRPSARLPGYPPELEKIVVKAMSREREERFATAEELGRALERFLLLEKKIVSDGQISELVRRTLSEPIARRTSNIASAAEAIDNPMADPLDGASPLLTTKDTDVTDPVIRTAASAIQPTLSGATLPGPTARRAPRALFIGIGAALAVALGALALVRREPRTEPGEPASAAQTTAASSPAQTSVEPAPVAPLSPVASVAPVAAPSASATLAPSPSATARKPRAPVVHRTAAPPTPASSKPTAPTPTTRPVRSLDPENPFSTKR